MAVQKRKSCRDAAFNSDQRCQYTSESYQRSLREFDIESSMSRAENYLNNVVTERFFRSLKSKQALPSLRDSKPSHSRYNQLC
ncbi:hypothetical protein F6450_14670 [Photobacterium damselae subsp. damselae]|uniref:Integrase catalytic domain-containing protein n=1 Tax=Photobacterium damselae subsp. damselae TaxID=85581 RepID=A0AAD3WU42_PHODD|nr:hypothetical protein F6450_14670 [Photobacterium damselae subsp. damselae]